MSIRTNEVYRFDDFELQTSRRLLLRSGERIPLPPKAFDVLVHLLDHAGTVALKDDLLKAVWPNSFVEESNLTQQVFSLRRALGDKGGYIVTIPGRGYEFTGAVQVFSEAERTVVSGESAAGPAQTLHLRQTVELTHVVVEETVPAMAAPPRTRPAWRSPAVLAVAALLLLGLAGWVAFSRLHRVVPGDHHEVVLADFENSTGDPGFDRALKTLLTFDLSQSPFLAVASESDARSMLKLMKQSPDAQLTPSIAREVCERMNDQVVLAGNVASAGQKYLVTLTASDCADGKDLVETKAVAQNRDGVIAAVDAAAADMRKRLGEPLRTLQAGQKLEAVHTNSLQALKLYGEARAQHVRYKFQNAAGLYEKAIEADPNFASAYAQLANCYNNLGEQSKGENAMAKAYALRDQTDDLDRMRITTMYEYWKTGDRHQAILNYRTWTEMFPNSAAGWDLLGEFEDSVGDSSAAIEAEKRALQVNPRGISQYVALSQFEFSEGRFEEVKATCRQAFANGVDLAELHHVLRDTAVFQHDDAAVREQTEWLEKNGEPDDRDDAEGDLNLSRGKIRAGLALKLAAVDAIRKDGRTQAAMEKLSAIAATEADLGLAAQAREHLRAFHPAPAINGEALTNVISAAAETGDLTFAESLLNHMVGTNAKDSDVREFFAPEAHAMLALARHKPQEAIAALTPALPYAHVYPSVYDLRGRAYLEAHEPEQAAADFREIVDHPSASGLGEVNGTELVELARALAQSGNAAAARAEYATFFTLWKDADPDLPIVRAAQREYAELPSH